MEATADPKEKHERLVADLRARQQTCPPDAPRYDPEWFTARERYLLEHGWEKELAETGIPTYRDPKVSCLQGEYKLVAELPNKGDDLHPTIPVRQFHVPSASYSFTIEEALDIQRRRDATGTGGPSPLDRLGIVEQRCNDAERQLAQLKGRIKGLLTSHQLTFEGMKLGLKELIGL